MAEFIAELLRQPDRKHVGRVPAGIEALVQTGQDQLRGHGGAQALAALFPGDVDLDLDAVPVPGVGRRGADELAVLQDSPAAAQLEELFLGLKDVPLFVPLFLRFVYRRWAGFPRVPCCLLPDYYSFLLTISPLMVRLLSPKTILTMPSLRPNSFSPMG